MLRPSIEIIEVVSGEVIIPEVELEVKPPEPVVPQEKEILRQEDIIEPVEEEMVEPQVEEAGEIVARVDSHIYQGYIIPPYYDSLIAKLIVHAEDRNLAILRMQRALEKF